MQVYGLDRPSVTRLALFILAYTMIDQMLTSLVIAGKFDSWANVLGTTSPLSIAKKDSKYEVCTTAQARPTAPLEDILRHRQRTKRC